MNLNNKLKKLLHDTGLTQANIASIMNVSRPTITYWLNGSHKPSDFHLKQLSVFFNIKLIWFTDNTLDYPPSSDYKLNGNGQYSDANNKDNNLPENRIIKLSDIEHFNDNLKQNHELNRLILIDYPEIRVILKDIENSLNNNNIYTTVCLFNKLKVLLHTTFLKIKMGDKKSHKNEDKQNKE